MLLLFACNNAKRSQVTEGEVILYKKDGVAPVILISDNATKSEKSHATLFQDYFKQATQHELQIETQAKYNKKLFSIETQLQESLETQMQDGFSLHFIEGKKLIIKGNSNLGIEFGIAHFFKKYTKLYAPENHAKESTIRVPYSAVTEENPVFEYREPYFAPNMDYKTSLANKTNQLENKWALWGHNLHKIIPKKTNPTLIYAQLNGQINEEQLCFSSPELETILSEFIEHKLLENSEVNYFTIAPFDNDLVCQCQKCSALGNTNTNASPAVFTLMNVLAKKFKKAYFFSNAYLSSQKPPNFLLEKNTGIIISTIDYANAVPIARAKNEPQLAQLIDSWKKTTSKIYIWTYGVNFDCYFDFYPTLKIEQENLNYFKQKGVDGIFMNGSEYDYATLDFLKHDLYGQLFWNPDLNLDQEIKKYFDTYLPTLSATLTKFYINLENKALQNTKQQSIYSGIEVASKKYLEVNEFLTFYDNIDSKKLLIQDFERIKYAQLMLSLQFLKLELMRTHPFEKWSYAGFANNNTTINNNLQLALNNLKKLSEQTKITFIDEQKSTLDDYIDLWQKQIINAPRKNIFFKKPFAITTKLDEDYTNVKMLNDGCFGFKNYNTNWFINSQPNLTIRIETNTVKPINTLIISFLNDKKHRIVLPEKIEIFADGKNIVSKVIAPNLSELKSINSFSIPLSVPKNTLQIDIQIINIPNRSMAIDEIILQ
jgi:Domain of unknown function (DUF4838)